LEKGYKTKQKKQKMVKTSKEFDEKLIKRLGTN